MNFSISLLLHTCLLHSFLSTVFSNAINLFLAKKEEFKFSAHSEQWEKLYFHLCLVHEAWILKYVVFSILQNMV